MLTAAIKTGEGPSHCDAILLVLAHRRGEWVSIRDLHTASGSYVVHSRIADLRKRGHVVEHRNEWHGRACHSFYRLA